MAVTQRYLVIGANVRNATLVRQTKKSFKKEIEFTMPGTHEFFVAKVEEEYVDGNGNILWNKMDLL